MTDGQYDYDLLTRQIKAWGQELGFDQVGIADTDLTKAECHLHHWLDRGFHGEMSYMQAHGNKRSRPADLVPGTQRVVSLRMCYLPEPQQLSHQLLSTPAQAFISRYALGRDYHKVLRKRLQQLANRIEKTVGQFGYRVFVDSAPVLEKALAEKAGLGWIGKHSNLIDRHTGSWFFLGELYTDLPLTVDNPSANHCGTCQACMDICPTKAIVAPYLLDARRCISYLTIELRGAIPVEFRKAIGNRIYGCDDCQLICPWNRFAHLSGEHDFFPRRGLDRASLIELFVWSEDEFLHRTEGSAIRRIGHLSWLRNIAVALGNAPHSAAVITALNKHRDHPSTVVREHVAWAVDQQSQGNLRK